MGCFSQWCPGPRDEVRRLFDLVALGQQDHEQPRLLAGVDGGEHLQRRDRAVAELELPHHLWLAMRCVVNTLSGNAL